VRKATVVDILTNDERYEKYPDSQHRAFAQRLPNGHWLMRAGHADRYDRSLLYYELDAPPQPDEFGRIELSAPPLRVVLRRIWKSDWTSIPGFLLLYIRGAWFSSRVWKARILLLDAYLRILRRRLASAMPRHRIGRSNQSLPARRLPDAPTRIGEPVTGTDQRPRQATSPLMNRHVPVTAIGGDELVMEQLPEGRVKLWLIPSGTPDDKVETLRRSPVGLTVTAELLVSLEHLVFQGARLREIEVEMRMLETVRAERMALLSSRVRGDSADK
jgi:hypothetical protein